MQELAQRNPRPPALVTREGSLCRPPYGIVPIRLTRPRTPTHTHARDALEPRSPCPSPGCGMRQCQRQASPRIGRVPVHVVSGTDFEGKAPNAHGPCTESEQLNFDAGGGESEYSEYTSEDE